MSFIVVMDMDGVFVYEVSTKGWEAEDYDNFIDDKHNINSCTWQLYRRNPKIHQRGKVEWTPGD